MLQVTEYLKVRLSDPCNRGGRFTSVVRVSGRDGQCADCRLKNQLLGRQRGIQKTLVHCIAWATVETRAAAAIAAQEAMVVDVSSVLLLPSLRLVVAR